MKTTPRRRSVPKAAAPLAEPENLLTASGAAPVAEEAGIKSAPKSRRGRKNYHRRKILEPGQASPHSKLNDELERQFCSLIMNQAKIEDAADCFGIHRTTVQDWRAWGRERPGTRWAQFEEAITKALTLAKVAMIRDIAHHPDIRGKMFLLKNRYPAEYRDRIWTEPSGPDGGPVPLQSNPFVVHVTLAQASDAREFQIAPATGNGERQP
jgi:hypothetical protein